MNAKAKTKRQKVTEISTHSSTQRATKATNSKWLDIAAYVCRRMTHTPMN